MPAMVKRRLLPPSATCTEHFEHPDQANVINSPRGGSSLGRLSARSGRSASKNWTAHLSYRISKKQGLSRKARPLSFVAVALSPNGGRIEQHVAERLVADSAPRRATFPYSASLRAADHLRQAR